MSREDRIPGGTPARWFAMACGIDAPLINQLGHVPEGTELLTRIRVPVGARWAVDVLETGQPPGAGAEG